MSRVRLNAAAIRDARLPAKAPPPNAGAMLADLAPDALLVTRREAVAIAGVAAAAVSAATGAVPALAALGPVTVIATARRARFAAGSLAFVVDPMRFGGSPRLASSTTASGTSAALTGARFAGTELPADMTFETAGSGATTRLKIRCKLGGFEAEVPLAKWLAGEAKATSAVRFSGETCPLKGLAALKLSGSGTATFGADWTMRIEGANIARVTGLGNGIAGDVVSIAVPDEAVPTVFTRKIKRRTLVTLERGTHEWALSAPSGNGTGGVTLGKDAFDSLTLEAAETADGHPYRAVIAQSDSADVKAAFQAKVLRGATGKAAALPLAAIRYARAFDAEGDTFVLAADLPAKGAWLHGNGYALLVTPGAAPFEMSGSGRLADTVVCQPKVSALSVPMGDAIVEPIRYRDDSDVTVTLGNSTPSGTVKAQAIVINPDTTPFIIVDQAAVTVTRPQDLLRLRFEFDNLYVSTASGSPKLIRRLRTRSTSTLVVVFPPQHILEAAFWETDALPQGPSENTAVPPIWNTIAGESRLAFTIPSSKGDAGIPFTLAGLLDWSSYNLVVPDAAEYIAVPPVALSNPTETQTSLEIPWGIYLSPTQYARWLHKTDPFGSNNVYELWHTKYIGDYQPLLGLSAQALNGGITPTTKPPVTPSVRYGYGSPRLRAVWARYYGNTGIEANPKRVPTELQRRNSFSRDSQIDTDPLGVLNRWTIADLTGKYRKPPLDVRQLMLTSQGAWMSTIGNWPTDEYTDAGLPIIQQIGTWEHRMTQGRDHYVKLTFLGRIFPFGHKAVEVQITERKFSTAPGSSKPTAYLLQRKYIVIREPVRTYELSDFAANRKYRARMMPFKRVEFKTTITPPIEGADIYNGTNRASYWITLAEPASHPKFMFQVEATDWDGNLIKFEAPMIFVDETIAARKITPKPSASTPLNTTFANLNWAYSRTSIDLKGQIVTYAEPLPSNITKDTRQLPTQSIKFYSEAPGVANVGAGERLFHPKMFSAVVVLDTAGQITNQTAIPTITLADVYINNGYSGPNSKGLAFANVNPKIASIMPVTPGVITNITPGIVSNMADEGLPLEFPGSQAGGLATPSQTIRGLSAYAGPFGGAVNAFADGFGDGTSFNPGDFFGSMLEAKLIGGVRLIDLLTNMLGLDDIPGFTKEIKEENGEKKLIAGFNWVVDNKVRTKIKKALIFEPTSTTALKLKAEMTKSLTDLTAEPNSVIEGTLSDFYINLIGDDAEFLNLVFGTFSFSSVNGGAPKINPGLEDVLFAGPLEFLNELRQFLGVFGGKGTQSQALATNGDISAMQLGSFNVGPFLVEFDTTGLFISIDIAIPNVSVGVMALSNMSLGAKVSLMWDGSPILVDFNFCTKESQMTISVCGWGGGGYVLLKLATGDPVMRLLEIGFWFGASASIDIVVASGSVEIKGGFTFTIADDGTKETLSFTAYIRLSGRLDILGIIKVSLTFELTLTYEQFDKDGGGGKGDRLTGTATLTVEIDLWLFSFSVEATCSQEIAGNDPRFGETMDAAEWALYCKAFAPATLGA